MAGNFHTINWPCGLDFSDQSALPYSAMERTSTGLRIKTTFRMVEPIP
jgi:hypothetical protein